MQVTSHTVPIKLISQLDLAQAFLERQEAKFKLCDLEKPECSTKDTHWTSVMINVIVNDYEKIVTNNLNVQIICNSSCYQIVKFKESYYAFVTLDIPNSSDPFDGLEEYVELGKNELGIPPHWWIRSVITKNLATIYQFKPPSAYLAPVGSNWNWVTGFHFVTIEELSGSKVYFPTQTQQG